MTRLLEHNQQEARGDRGADHTGHVGAHGVHQQEIGGVVFPPLVLRHTGGHGNGGNARRADQGIDLALGHDVQDLADQYAAGGGEHEGHQAQHHDLDGLPLDEIHAVGRRADAHAQHDGDDVHQRVLRRVGEPVHHAGFPEQVAQHQHAQQRHHGGQQEGHQHQHHHREDDLFRFGYFSELGHFDLTLFFCCQQLHDGRLDNGDQRHVGVGRQRDKTNS